MTRTTIIAALALTAALTNGLTAGQLGSRPPEEWTKTLESPERLAGLRIDDVVSRLKLAPGNVVADLGAGSGPFEVPLARAVAPGGRVYAVDIDSGFFAFIDAKAKAAGVTNVQTVRGEFTDPKLPARDVDIALLHDVLHHIDDRASYIRNAGRYLKPNGRIAVIDYNPGQGPHPADPKLQVSKEQAAVWLAAAGFVPAEDVQLFTDKWFVVYRRP